MYYPAGPQMTWTQVTSHHMCTPHSTIPGSQLSCDIFHDNTASTISLSILVTIEMFNALNGISENQSILVMPPFMNMWLIGAVALSFGLHFLILYVPFMSQIFSCVPLGWTEWKIVLGFSFPVVVIDELLKFVSRLTGIGIPPKHHEKPE